MNLASRIAALETRLAALEAATRRTGRPFILIEGKDGTREELRRRAAEESAGSGKGALIILHTDPRLRPDELPPGAVGFDLRDVDL